VVSAWLVAAADPRAVGVHPHLGTLERKYLLGRLALPSCHHCVASARVSQRPEHADVGPHRYRIHWDQAHMDRARAEEECANMDGRVRYSTCEQWIDTAQSPSNQRTVLLHEVFHAVRDLSGEIVFTNKTTEDDVFRRLDAGLLDVLRRNPQVVAFLCAKDSEGA
jgi:hypothetical protein